MIQLTLTLVLCSLNTIKCQYLEPFIHNGDMSNITNFPHATCLSVNFCNPNEDQKESWMCGSSILNQRILLTAAHCVHGCTKRSILTVQFGKSDRINASFLFVKSHKEHPHYGERTTSNDIALVLLWRTLELSSDVARVAIYPKIYTPYNDVGVVAGWGYLDVSARNYLL